MSVHGLVRGFTAAVVALFLLVSASDGPLARAAADAPALWKIDGPKGDVYLFGSVHLLPAGVNWRTPALDAALNEAEVVVFELDLDESKNFVMMQSLISKLGLLPAGETLRRLLAPEQRTKLERVANAIGLSAPMLDPLRPWFAAVMIGVQWIVSKGYDPNSGVDELIWNWAGQNGKQRQALETAEEQLGAFAGLTRAEETEFLIVTLDQIEQQPAMLDDLVGAWRKGHTVELDKLLNAGMEEMPALTQRLLRNRHEKWLPQIEKMLAGGRTHVVIVGAAHLVGEDSVIAMLRAKGVKVEGP